jgi:plasmid replication initiation protein
MKLTKKVSISGEFAKKKEDIKDGDIIKVLDGGTITEGEYGKQNTFRIETCNGEKLFSFNQTSQNNLIDAFGEETDNWIGKEVKVWMIKAMVGGKMQDIVYLSHPEWTMDDEGKFHATIQVN